MKYKQIPIQRKLLSINKILADVTECGGYIIGGAARYCASPRSDVEKPGDIDVYSSSEDSFKQLYKYLTDAGHQPEHENDVAVTFEKKSGMQYPVQLIKPVKEGKIVTYGSLEEILDNFDFTIVKCAVLDNNTCLVHENFEDHENKKLLVLTNIHCPISSLFRCMKYYKKYGYWLKPVEAIKLFRDWDSRTEEYRQKLIDFCTKADEFDPDKPQTDTLSEKQVMELERMMMLD